MRKVSKEELKALKIKSSTILLQYVLDIFKEVNLIIGDLKAANNTPDKDGESWENVSGIWKRALMHYYKVLQRIPDPEVEGFIVNIRESYRE